MLSLIAEGVQHLRSVLFLQCATGGEGTDGLCENQVFCSRMRSNVYFDERMGIFTAALFLPSYFVMHTSLLLPIAPLFQFGYVS